MPQVQAVHQDLDCWRVLRRAGKVHLIEGDVGVHSPLGFSVIRGAVQSCSLNLLHKTVPQSRSRELLSKAAPNSCSPKLLKLPPKVVSESCFPKLLSKAAPQSCRSSKQLFVNAAAKPQSSSPPNAASQRSPSKLQSCSPQLFPGAAPQSYSPKLLPQSCDLPKVFLQSGSRKLSQSCYRKLLSKAAVLQGNCSAKWSKLLPKAVPRSCFLKLFPKAPLQSACPKAAPESCSPKLLPKATPQSCVLKLVPKAAVLQSCCSKLPCKTQSFSCSPKLLPKLAPQSCSQSSSLQLLPKAVPQSTAAKRLPQSCYASNLFPKRLPQSYCPKRLPKAAPPPLPKKLRSKDSSQSCSPKLRFFKAAVQSWSSKLLLLPKAAPQSCSIKLFPKATPESCYQKLLRTAAPPSCHRKLFPKAASQSCFLNLLPKAAVLQSSCSSMLLQGRKVAPHSCSPKLLPKAASQRSSPKQRAQAKEARTVCAVEGGCSKRAVSQRCVVEKAQRQ